MKTASDANRQSAIFEPRIWRKAYHIPANPHCEGEECKRTINHDHQNVCACACYECRRANASPAGEDIPASWAVYDIESGILISYSESEEQAKRQVKSWTATRPDAVIRKAESARKLCKMLKPGDTVSTLLRHVSRSGMMRHISLFANDPNGGVTDITWHVANVLGDKRADDGGIKVGGCGMDMGFSLVYTLSSALFRDGFKCIGRDENKGIYCPANDHNNGDRIYTAHDHPNAGGYALRHRWL